MSKLLITDVTAVKFCNNFILAGIGSHVNLFSKSNCKLLDRKHVLKGQRIYGIVPVQNDNKFLIFGGKQFTTIILENTDDNVKISQLYKCLICDDWIHASVWSSCTDVVLLTAHNVVQVWNIVQGSIISKHESRNNSILYSGLLLPIATGVLVFGGTVFSEILIQTMRDELLHTLKGHRGVIFSIACDTEKEIIVTTSDDRSVRIWGPNNCVQLPKNSLDYWKNIDIICKKEVYGHLARVMRCSISRSCIASAGEDAVICFWNIEGQFIKKISSHQNGCIWAIDTNDNQIVSGGADGSVILHPLNIAMEYGINKTIPIGNVKKIQFTSRGNMVILCDNSDLVYYDVVDNTLQVVCKLVHESTYKLLSISSCKQIISVVDMFGHLDIFVENCKENNFSRILTSKLTLDNILSMHWAGNRYLVICCENGIINVLVANSSGTTVHATFILPDCKERWLTAVAIDTTFKLFAFGDRCGNIHFYSKGQRDPIHTVRKVHGRYGPTSITMKTDQFISTGRDGTLKYFSFSNSVKNIYTADLNFQWVEMFLDKDENLVCGFQERVFLVYDLKRCATVVEVSCGGGHRAWDAHRYFKKINDGFEERITFAYFKNSEINMTTFELNKIIPNNIILGSHVKEVNCLKVYVTDLDKATYLISGGQDTTVRISRVNTGETWSFGDKLIFKQLSNVRCICIHEIKKDKLVMISAGGRAQISVKLLHFHKDVIKSDYIIDYFIKGTDKERKGDTNWRNCTVDFDPECRIMSVDIVCMEDYYYIFAGCSDSALRIFKLTLTDNTTFEAVETVIYHQTCILKIKSFIIENNNLIVTATTTGELAFWDFFLNNKLKDLSDIKPSFVTKTNKSGINSIAIEKINENEVLVATGGDDNAIHLFILNSEKAILKITHTGSNDKYHSGLVSGLYLLDNRILLSTSVDQRVTLTQWRLEDGALKLDCLCQVCSDVPDIQGLDVVLSTEDSVTVCVHGKGVEIIKMTIPKR